MNNKAFYIVSVIILIAALGAALILTGDSPSSTQTPVIQAPSAPSDSGFSNFKIQ